MFDQWMSMIFDRPATRRYWSREPEDAQHWDGPYDAVIGYMTRLFLEADTILAPFSDAQAAQGLYALLSNWPTDHPLLDQTVPLQARLHCIGAMAALFEKYFALRCTPHLSHLDTAEAGTPAHVSPLNGVCYMWWDLLPVHGITRLRPGNPDGPELDHAIFSAIRHCLEIASVACQESALLGLMEWSPYYDETSDIAVDYLSRNEDIRPELQAFAWRVVVDFSRGYETFERNDT